MDATPEQRVLIAKHFEQPFLKMATPNYCSCVQRARESDWTAIGLPTGYQPTFENFDGVEGTGEALIAALAGAGIGRFTR